MAEDPRLPRYFNKDQRKEMKEKCLAVARTYCLKCATRECGNLFRVYCAESDCGFLIHYNFRYGPKNPAGFYLNTKQSNDKHKIDCPNTVSSVDNTRDPKVIAQRILPLFNKKHPSTLDIRNAIRCFNQVEFTDGQIKYIKKLAKAMALLEPKDTIQRLMIICEKLSHVHRWKVHVEYIENMISAIVLFPPWADNVLKYYHSPLIVDATWTDEDLRFTHAAVMDGDI